MKASAIKDLRLQVIFENSLIIARTFRRLQFEVIYQTRATVLLHL